MDNIYNNILLFFASILGEILYLCILNDNHSNMQVLSKEQQTFIETNAESILKERGISKATFTKAFNVLPQNFNKLVGTKNIVTLTQIAKYLDMPLDVLLFGKEQQVQDIHGVLYVDNKPVIVENRKQIEELLKNSPE